MGTSTIADGLRKGKRLLERAWDGLLAAGIDEANAKRLVEWMRAYILFHDRRHPDAMGTAESRAAFRPLANRRICFCIRPSGSYDRRLPVPPRRSSFVVTDQRHESTGGQRDDVGSISELKNLLQHLAVGGTKGADQKSAFA